MAEREIHQSEILLNMASVDREVAYAKKMEAEARLFAAQEAQALIFADQAAIETEIARLRKMNAIQELHQSEYATQSVRIQVEELIRKESQELARDKHHRFYNFDQDVDGRSVKACIAQLAEWHRNDQESPPQAMEICFNSDGGDAVQGLALYDYIQYLKDAGHWITTSAIGVAASMAGILLQAGNHRVLGAESWIMIHEGSIGIQGKLSDLQDTKDWLDSMHRRIANIFVEHSQQSKAPEKLDLTSYLEKTVRRTWWVDSDEALRCGLVDEIR